MDYSQATRSESHGAAGHLPNWFARALLCRTLAVTLLTMGAWVQAKAQVLVGYVANSQDGTVSLLAINTIAANSGPVQGPFFATALNGDSPFLIDVGKNSPVRLATTPEGDVVFVSNQANNTITVIDTTTNQVLTPVIQVGPLQSGGLAPQPQGMAVFAQGAVRWLYVANTGDNSVSVIDVTDFKKTRKATPLFRITNNIGPAPIEIAFSHDLSLAYILNNGNGGAGSVTVLDTTQNPPTLATAKPIPVGSNPTGIAASDDGNLVYVANRGSHSISVISPGSLGATPTEIDVTDPVGVAFVPGEEVAFVTNSSAGTVTEIDVSTKPPTLTPIALLPANSHPSQIVINPDQTTAFTAFITDPVNGQVLTVIDDDGTFSAGTPSRLVAGNGAAGITLVASAPNPSVCGVSVSFTDGLPSKPNGAGVCVPSSQALGMAFQIANQNAASGFACTGQGAGENAGNPGSSCSDVGVVGGQEDFAAQDVAPGIYTVVICPNGGAPPACGGVPSARQAIAVPALTAPVIICTPVNFTMTTPASLNVAAASTCVDSAATLQNFTVPSTPLALQMKLDWNDGTAPKTAQASPPTPGPTGDTISGPHTYGKDGQQSVTVSAIDNILGFANPVITPVQITNAPPTCAPSASVDGFTVTLSPNCTDDDPGLQPIQSIVIDWGSQGKSTTQLLQQVNAPAPFLYPTTNFQTMPPITITAMDSLGASSTTHFTVPVPNFIPQGPNCSFPSQPTANGLTATIAVACNVTATGDTISTVTVTFDTVNKISTTVQAPPNTTSYSNTFTHTYTVDGVYKLSVSATDSTGLPTANAGSATVSVSTPLPPLCTLAVTGTGGLSVAASATCKDQVNTVTDLTVNFGDDTVVHGTGGALTVSQTFTHTYAAAGTYTVVLTGTNSVPLTSTPASQAITVPSSLAISAPSETTVSAGGTVKYTVTLPSTFPDPNPPLTLSCTGNPPGTPLPTGIQCLFTPATIAPGGSSTLTLATNSPPLITGLRMPSLTGLGLALLPAILLMGSTTGRKTGTVRLVAVCLAMSLTLFLGACGTNTPAVQSNAATPPGTYNVLVQVTDATNTVVGSNALTVTVK